MQLLFFSSFIFITNISGQKMYLTEHPVYLDVIKQYIFVFSKQDSSIRTNRGDQNTQYIKVFKLTSKGAMQFVFNDTSSHNTVKGQYTGATKFSKPKGYIRDGVRIGTSEGGIAQFYYSPLRDGIWTYYDNTGNVVKREIYKKGKCINCLSVTSPKFD